jgi:C_GCAxxG_C_C family probable redox protein
MIDKPNNQLLKAYTGLEGGVVASGSTCGVVSGGAMGLAISHYEDLMINGLPAQVGMLSLIGDYVKWFEDSYGSSYCRERSGLDFYKAMGQIRLLIPGDKIMKCMWHIRGAIRQLYSYHKRELPYVNINNSEDEDEPIHCAEKVLMGIREQTRIGNENLEQLSFIFDGGVGLQGGVCGALAGAIMGVNLLVGLNIRDTSYYQSLKAFTVGHINLLKNKPVKSPEPFNVGKQIVQKFKEEAGGMECNVISGENFPEWTDYQNYVKSSKKCKGLIEFATDEASKAIEMYKPMVV